MLRLAVPALAALLALVCPAGAAQVCLPWQEALKTAFKNFGELPAFIATTNGGAVITITVAPEKHTFTVWVQRNSETLCAVDAGENWGPAPEAVRNSVTDPA